MLSSALLAILLATSAATGVSAAAAAPARGRARSKSAAAEQHYQAGLVHYGAAKYGRAAAAFEAAAAIEPVPKVLYALAQAQRLSGDCEAAVRSYKRFLQSRPTAKQANAARQQIGGCVAALKNTGTARAGAGDPADGGDARRGATDDAAQRPAARTAEPASADDAESSGPSIWTGDEPLLWLPAPSAPNDGPGAERGTVRVRKRAGAERWYRDWMGHVLAGAGGVATGFAVYNRHEEQRRRKLIRRFRSYGRHVTHAEAIVDARRNQILGFSAAGLLVGGALVRYVWAHQTGAPHGPDALLSLGLGEDSMTLALGARF